jgi:2-polyprenyl-6-methoxyphenol hydroxylase-like FAD-dependent oxidoreductase
MHGITANNVTSRRLTAIVAGGGVGGLATASALARRGVAVTVIERAASFTDVGSGLVLYPNGVAAADAISPGLGRRIRLAGHISGPDESRLVLTAGGKVLAREPIGQAQHRYGRPQISILRTALQDALTSEARAAGAQLQLGLAVRDYANTGDSVSVQLSDGSTRHADLLVAADGIRSALRRRMLGDGPPRYSGYTSVRGRTTGTWLSAQGFVANGRGVQLFTAPVGPHSLYWTAKITAPAGTWPELRGAAALRALTGRLRGWHDPIVRLVAEASQDDVTVTDICDRDPVPHWVDGRVALLGDAAHPMAPALGQAANMALEDAAVLAHALGSHGAPGDGADIRAALRAYQRERAARTAPVVLASRRQGSLDQGAGRVRALVRNAGTRLRGRKDAAIPDLIAWTPPAGAGQWGR